jgi:hypothetical protein
MLNQFANHRYLNLETYRKSGQPVCTPLWFAAEGDTLYVYTRSGSGKLKRIRRDPRVRLAPCGLRGKPKGMWVEGEARIVTDAAEVKWVRQLLAHKFGWQMRLGDVQDWLTKTQRVVIALRLQPELAHEFSTIP